MNNNYEYYFYESKETYIHPSSIVGANVKLGENVKIGPFCVLQGNINIGSNTRLYPGVTVGAPAQNIGTLKSLGTINIGQDCEIREYVTIGASKYPEGHTSIGNNCYIMSYCHIAHDVVIENNVTLINSVNLGGHVHVGANAILMANSAAHQFCKIGAYTALAPYSAIRQDIPPFCIFNGLPANFAGLNLIGLKRAGFTRENLNNIKHLTKLFYQDKLLLEDIKNLSLKEEWGKDLKVQELMSFIENSKRGVSRRVLND